MWRCPSCGVPIEALYEARKMRPTVVATGGTRNHKGWQRVEDRPWPHPEVVVQPCGCLIPAPMARTLATPHQ